MAAYHQIRGICQGLVEPFNTARAYLGPESVGIEYNGARKAMERQGTFGLNVESTIPAVEPAQHAQ